jgi:hypothetical protein
MGGILARIGQHKAMANADRGRLVAIAADMHAKGLRSSEIEAALEDHGALHEEARTICGEGRLEFNSRVAGNLPLPASARSPLNYYFVLGVTPRSSTERIRRAYRMRAREVHPDQHQLELEREHWGEVMSVVSDAYKVLTDEQLRRAYDVHWMRRSQRVTVEWAKPTERRGDWDTRYHWYMAEVAEIEDNLEIMLEDIEARLRRGEVLDEGILAAASATDLYEERVLNLRTDALAVPQPHGKVAERARLELVRKERLVTALGEVILGLPQGAYAPDEGAAALRSLEGIAATRAMVRDGHRRFEIDALSEATA